MKLPLEGRKAFQHASVDGQAPLLSKSRALHASMKYSTTPKEVMFLVFDRQPLHVMACP